MNIEQQISAISNALNIKGVTYKHIKEPTPWGGTNDVITLYWAGAKTEIRIRDEMFRDHRRDVIADSLSRGMDGLKRMVLEPHIKEVWRDASEMVNGYFCIRYPCDDLPDDKHGFYDLVRAARKQSVR